MGCHFLLQGDLLDPGMEPGSPAFQADALPSEPPDGKEVNRNVSLTVTERQETELSVRETALQSPRRPCYLHISYIVLVIFVATKPCFLEQLSSPLLQFPECQTSVFFFFFFPAGKLSFGKFLALFR